MDTQFSTQNVAAAAAAQISSLHEEHKSKQENHHQPKQPEYLISVNAGPTSNDVGGLTTQDLDIQVVDYSRRAQWLRAAVLGANDGLLSTASLMMGIGAVRTDVKVMVLSGIAGLVAGASSMALGEFVSVYSQYDIEFAQLKRDKRLNMIDKSEFDAKKKDLPSPLKAALASASSFAVGALVPLLAAAFIKNYHLRLGVVVATVSLALLVFGCLGAYLGRAPLVKSSVRVLVGGLLAMGITFGLTKLIGKAAI